MIGAVTADDRSCSSGRRSMEDAYLDACRPQPISAAEKESVISSLPPEGEITDFSVAEREKLRSLRRVLDIHRRDNVYEIKVTDVAPATTALHGKAVLLISRSALQILSSEELQALTAHEIGHEHVWKDWHADPC
jgi:Zn-dependent protease with chaperone function